MAIKALADGQLASSKGTLYTVPTSTSAIVRSIILVNTDTVSRAVNLYAKPGSTSRRLISKDLVLGAGENLVFDTPITLEEGDLIEGDAAAATVVDFIISGAEETA